MKLSKLRPCDNCGEPLTSFWKVARVSMAILDQYFGNTSGALAVAEADDAVVVAMDIKDPVFGNPEDMGIIYMSTSEVFHV